MGGENENWGQGYTAGESKRSVICFRIANLISVWFIGRLLFISICTVTLRAKFPPDLLLLVQNGDCRSRWGYFLLFRHGRAAMVLFPLTLRPSFFPKEPFLSLFLSSFHLFCFSFASSLHLFLFPFSYRLECPGATPILDISFSRLLLLLRDVTKLAKEVWAAAATSWKCRDVFFFFSFL